MPERGDACLDVVLLEKQPAQGLRAVETIRGQVGRALGEVAEDRVRFGKSASILKLQDGNRPHRIELQERRIARTTE